MLHVSTFTYISVQSLDTYARKLTHNLHMVHNCISSQLLSQAIITSPQLQHHRQTLTPESPTETVMIFRRLPLRLFSPQKRRETLLFQARDKMWAHLVDREWHLYTTHCVKQHFRSVSGSINAAVICVVLWCTWNYLHLLLAILVHFAGKQLHHLRDDVWCDWTMRPHTIHVGEGDPRCPL